jgi:hypothetical protein
MKTIFVITLLLSLFSSLVFAVKVPPKSVVITYPKGTPGSVYDQAKEEIEKAGGIITHEFHLFM